ncbi:MAG: hypothetical protein ACO3HJ_06190, partial [Methylophilaceae bacterium]
RLRTMFDNLSNQAKFALLAGLLLLIREIMNTKSLSTAAATGILSIFGTMVISTYAVDCYSKGNCELLAWFASGSLFISTLVLFMNNNK